MSAKHTPTPWRVVVRSNQTGVRSVAVDASAKGGRCWVPQSHGRAIAWTEKDAEDGRFIARAVNSHDVLVEALEDCIQSLERLPNVDGAYRVTCIQQARAAIAKAKGE